MTGISAFEWLAMLAFPAAFLALLVLKARAQRQAGPPRGSPHKRPEEASDAAASAVAELHQARARVARLAEEVAELSAQLDRLKASGREIIAQRDAARARIVTLDAGMAELRAQLAELRSQLAAKTRQAEAPPPPPPPRGEEDRRFRELKTSFARLFHPDRATGGGPERRLREALFKEFWAEIERIERR